MDENKRRGKQERWRRWADKNREAERERVRRWRQENKSKTTIYQRQYARKKIGVTPERFASLFAGQGGACAVCKVTEPRGKKDWHVDHDHETGVVRGILCIACNIALGMLHDDPARCRAAADYLEFSKLL